MRIDCDRCPNRSGEGPCEDCLVTFVLRLEEGSLVVEDDGVDEGGPVILDAAEARAIRALSDAGLLPPVRLQPREAAG